MNRHSHLFTIRLWLEELSDSRSEWRGQVQLVASGETRYFRNWEALVAHLNDMLAESGDTEGVRDLLCDEQMTGK